MRSIGWICCVCVLATALFAQASPVVNLGHYYVVAGYTQSAALAVSDASNIAAEDIEGMKFTLQIGGGTASNPAISSVDFLSGTIWSGHVSSEDILPAAGGNLPQFKSFTLLTDTTGDFVNPSGTLATVSFSGVGAAPADYSLKLAGTKSPSSDSKFTNGIGNTVPAAFGNGTLTVIAPFDINGDGHVNVADVSALMRALTDLNGYQTSMGLTSAQLPQIADVNRDGSVNDADIQALISLIATNTVSGGGALTAVPEPSTLILSVIGLGFIAMRRL